MTPVTVKNLLIVETLSCLKLLNFATASDSDEVSSLCALACGHYASNRLYFPYQLRQRSKGYPGAFAGGFIHEQSTPI